MKLKSHEAEFKFESQFKPLLVIGNHSWRVLQKTIKCFDCNINCQALGKAFRDRFGRWDLHAQRGLAGWDLQAQCSLLSKSDAVSMGSNKLALGKVLSNLCY